MTFKMKGSGKVYYEGSGDSINLNPNDLGKEYLDEHGNRAYDHKKTKDVFYKNKPRHAADDARDKHISDSYQVFAK